MAQVTVKFTFHSGVTRHLFRNVRLSGSWNRWTVQTPMILAPDETGCDAFSATVPFDSSLTGTLFNWGVTADIVGAPNTWVVVTEVPDENSNQRTRSFTLTASGMQQDYWFATGRRFGAQKYLAGIRFAVWAPHARKVEVVFAPFDPATGTPTGYISDDGTGVNPAAPVLALNPVGGGVWECDLPTFSDYFNRLYMYRITNEQGAVTYKVDIFSRNQVGRGAKNPGGAHYTGSYLDLDGIVSCSIVSDPDQVTKDFDDTGVAKETLISADDFWASEYTAGKIPPTNTQDLVIYELHIGSLGFGSTNAGTFTDAMGMLDGPHFAWREYGGIAARPGIRRRCAVGLWDVPFLLSADERGRREPDEALRPGVPPAGYRSDSGCLL